MKINSLNNIKHACFRTFQLAIILISIQFLMACQSPHEKLREAVLDELSKAEGNGSFAVAFKDLSTGEEMLINECEKFHAASTMKTPVMIEIFKAIDRGKLSLKDTLLVKNEFNSIVDSSLYCLNITDDSDSITYAEIGQYRPLQELLNSMITISSNLATNILINQVDPKEITASMRALGANEVTVLRGVEDTPAFHHGLNNTITAYDMMLIFEKIAKGEVINATVSKQMIDILLKQKFNTIIPALLPTDVKVAHKTGWLTGVNHDTAIIFLPDGRKYILILLSKNVVDEASSIQTMARVSEIIYRHEMK